MDAWSAASTVVFNEMVNIQKEILSSLDLPCRILEMPTTDLGASAYRKIDIEAFFPSRTKKDEGWGEVTSASMCIDYQSKRLGTSIKGRGMEEIEYTLRHGEWMGSKEGLDYYSGGLETMDVWSDPYHQE